MENDINLNIYQKILVLIEFTHFFIEKDENILKFETIKFSYYSKNTMEIDSPLLSAINFLKEFIEDLDETSPFFIPLILIDSGKFIYNNESLYVYGLNSKEIVKFVKRGKLYDDVVNDFVKEFKAGKKLSCVMVTHSGSKTEKVIGILTSWDIIGR